MQVKADFNGLFSQLLCLSHSDVIESWEGHEIALREGMKVTAREEDYEDSKRDDLLASGIVERSPDWLACRGSRWALRIDEFGVRHESDLGPEQIGSN